ncbi:hypothetical protein [Kribbella sp. NPDC048928]|uniref:hypothetical protein n=1 Tax=Kribbella sp. NPDC048928 TaxID=3364111 RepID=UPI00371147EE
MASKRGRKYGEQVGRTAHLQVRVRPGISVKANAVADAAGVSLAAYIDALLEREELDENGIPMWWPKQEVMDFPQAG